MPYEPSVAAVLLFRRSQGQSAPDVYDITEYYYEPATRNSNAYLTTAGSFTPYALASSIIIDRWCVAVGVAPYTEARVHRTGSQGAITTDFVDGVSACERSCGMSVALSAGPVHNGRADLTATIQGAGGSVLLSLDGFQTPGTPPDTATTARFLDARPGTYTVTVREIRPGGCTAAASVTFTAPYGPRYTVTFSDIHSTPCLLEVLEREYTGTTEELVAQAEAVVLDWPGGVTDHLFTQLFKGSACEMALYLRTDEQLLPLFSGDERLHRVNYYRAGVRLWSGYLLPEQYDAAFLTPPTVFNLSASDGLGTLSTIPFTGSAGERLRGDWTALQVVLFCLNKLDLGLPLQVLFTLAPSSSLAGVGALEHFAVDVATYQSDEGTAWNCGQVLEALLVPFAARLYQWAGAWWLERLADLRVGDTAYLVYAPDGTRAVDLLANHLQAVQAPATRPHWSGGGQRQGLRPAVATVRVGLNPGEPVNLLRFALPANTDLPAAVPASWFSSSPTPTVPWSQLLYAGKSDPPTLRLVGTRGPAFGYLNGAASNAASLRSAFVQLPPTPPLPLPLAQGDPAHADETLVLRFTATPYGHTPNELTGQFSFIGVAVQYGPAWLGGISGQPETPLPQLLGAANFTTKDAVEAVIVLGGTAQHGTHPLALRLYAPVGGASACTVDITGISLRYETVTPEINDAYTTTTRGQTGLLVSRTDAELTLTQSDVPHARRAGTWLDRERLPVAGWLEPGNDVPREAADYLVRDRLAWQSAPAQGLAGTLLGPLPGPGTLLTDPAEARPAVYVLTSCQHRAASDEWDVTAVQDLLLVAPTATLPPDAIYFEDASAWRSEAGLILTYEHG